MAPQIIDEEPNAKIATQKCLETTTLDPDFYRIGHTKARLSFDFFERFNVSCSEFKKFQSRPNIFVSCQLWLINVFRKFSYLILAPTAMTNEKDPKISAKICFDSIGLDPELYRIGHTKASKIPLLWFCIFDLPV